MSNPFEIIANARKNVGKGASRRLRREKGLIPGVIYGGSEPPQSIEMEHRTIIKSIENEAFFSHILTCDVDGKKQKVVLKALQRHPYKPTVLHLDLLRISATEKLTMNIPLHFIGEDIAPGVKESGGIVSHQATEVEIRCLPKDLPEFIEVDISKLELDTALHLTDLQLPKDVELTVLSHDDEGTHNLSVVSIHLPRAVKEEEPSAEEAPSEESSEETKGGGEQEASE